MGFSQALSGLSAAASNLDVIGNNIANSQTVGFKGSRTQFADAYASAQGGVVRAGLGTKVAGILQNFDNGTLQGTGRALDLAVDGSGFLRFVQNGQVLYSRNGELTLTSDGYMINAQGANLTGYPPGVGTGGEPIPLRVPPEPMSPSATTGIDISLNLDSREPSYTNSATVYDSLGSPHDLTMIFTNNGDNTWDLTLNMDGAAMPGSHTLTFDNNGVLVGQAVGAVTESAAITFGAVGAGETITVSDGTNILELSSAAGMTADEVAEAFHDYITNGSTAVGDAVMSVGAGTLAGFQSNFSSGPRVGPGFTLTSTAAATDVPDIALGGTAAAPGTAAITQGQAGGAPGGPVQSVYAVNIGLGAYVESLDFEIAVASTQFASNSQLNSLRQNGYTAGDLLGVTINDDGSVIGNYSNLETAEIGNIVLANFINPEGLQPVGDNAWMISASSGEPLLGRPGEGKFGLVESGALEGSNVDMTAELVNLIIAQRFYQSNAQTIKAQDEVLQTTINMMR